VVVIYGWQNQIGWSQKNRKQIKKNSLLTVLHLKPLAKPYFLTFTFKDR
jgi:hypothetical protein